MLSVYMPLPEVRVTTGNTVVSNIEDIARSLNRNPSLLCTYMGFSLHARYKRQNVGVIFVGSHNYETIEEILRKFQGKYVICNQCGNSETTLEEYTSNKRTMNTMPFEVESESKIVNHIKCELCNSERPISPPIKCMAINKKSKNDMQAVFPSMGKKKCFQNHEIKEVLKRALNIPPMYASMTTFDILYDIKHIDLIKIVLLAIEIYIEEKKPIRYLWAEGGSTSKPTEFSKSLRAIFMSKANQENQFEILEALEEKAQTSKALMEQYPIVLQYMYFGKILEEHTIIKWHSIAVQHIPVSYTHLTLPTKA